MSTAIKRVVRSDLWIDDAFDQRLSKEKNLSLSVFEVNGEPAAVWKELSEAHVYHVSAAKDELPSSWFVHSELIANCPNLICVSAGGAGFDTVDVAACTAAGVAVVNQAGGNAVSVAEHTLGLMLGVSRRMAEGDRRMRHETAYSREEVMGHEIQGKTVGLVGIGHIGQRVASLARAFGMNVIATDPMLSVMRSRNAEPTRCHSNSSLSNLTSYHYTVPATPAQKD